MLGFVGKSKFNSVYEEEDYNYSRNGGFRRVSPAVEKAPSPHTVEPWYPTTPVASSVMTFSGSYAPPVNGSSSLQFVCTPAFYAHTGPGLTSSEVSSVR